MVNRNEICSYGSTFCMNASTTKCFTTRVFYFKITIHHNAKLVVHEKNLEEACEKQMKTSIHIHLYVIEKKLS